MADNIVTYIGSKKDEFDIDQYWFYANISGWEPTQLKLCLNENGDMVSGSNSFFEAYDELDNVTQWSLLNEARYHVPNYYRKAIYGKD